MATKKELSSGVRVIITGASSGIGRALAVMLAKKYQACLVLNARNKTLLDDTVAIVKAAGGSAVGVPGDVSDQALGKQLVDACVEKFGGVDILVNNAGLSKGGLVEEITPDAWKFVFGVNFFGALYAIYAVLPRFLEQGHGKIVNVSSVAGKVAFPGSVCYSASKFAMTGMSEGMAAELAGKGIDVITVCPGWVRTEFFDNNKIAVKANPTILGQRHDLQGWVMRNVLSISAEQCAEEIMKALESGSSSEIVLTAPGVIVERLLALLPHLKFDLIKKVPASR